MRKGVSTFARITELVELQIVLTTTDLFLPKFPQQALYLTSAQTCWSGILVFVYFSKHGCENRALDTGFSLRGAIPST